MAKIITRIKNMVKIKVELKIITQTHEFLNECQ